MCCKTVRTLFDYEACTGEIRPGFWLPLLCSTWHSHFIRWCRLAPFCLQNYRNSSFHRSIGAQNILQLLADCLESIFSVPVHPEGTLSGGDLVTAETLWAQWTHFTNCLKIPNLCSFLLSKFWTVNVASVYCWEEWPPSDISHHQRRAANNHAMFTDTYITSFPFLMLSLNISILTLSTSLNWVTAMWLAVYLR